MSRLKRLPYTTDQGACARARLGLLVLESDQTMEAELRQMTDIPDVGLYHARLANDTTVTPETLSKMEDELPKAAGLLPKYLGLSAIGYGCTSGATMIGEDRVAEIIAQHHPNVAATNPLSAAKAAFRALDMTRVGLLTPYSPDVTAAMQDAFQTAGFEISVIGSFHENDDTVVGRIDPASILAATIDVGTGNCDGVFVSCTSLRTATLIETAEAQLGKPVTSSNHALAWHLMRLAGISDVQNGYGKLFHRQLCGAQA